MLPCIGFASRRCSKRRGRKRERERKREKERGEGVTGMLWTSDRIDLSMWKDV